MTATGPYIFRLTVTDNEGLINTDVITITVNTAGSCATGPDLIISTDPYSSSATVTAGITTTMIAIVKNDGTLVTGPDPITHLFKFDDDTNHSTGVTYATSISGYIHPGNTTSISTPHTFTTSGTRYVSACADLDEDSIPANGTVTPELDETNNCSTWTAITVQGPAVPVVTITASPTSGDVDVVNPTIIWSATETPTSCTASGDWTGSRSVPTGNQSQGILTSVRTYTYTLTCTNAIGPSAPASATVVVNDGTTNVNGACGTTHYACTAGANVPPLSGTNQDPGTSSTDPWTWTCPGSGGGVSASCSEPFTVPKQCNDTVDNDGDGLKDTLDPGCHSDGDATNASSYVPTDDKEKNIKPIWIEI
jgi:hypothetical protein